MTTKNDYDTNIDKLIDELKNEILQETTHHYSKNSGLINRTLIREYNHYCKKQLKVLSYTHTL